MELIFGYDLLAILFVVAFIAGFIDTLAGGGGLIVLPALLSTGMPPVLALGTMKLQSAGGSFAASLYFIRKKTVCLAQHKWNIFCTFVGSVFGVVTVQFIDAGVLRGMLPILTIAVGLYFLLSPKVGDVDRQQRIKSTLFGVVAGAPLGFYDGFFGPGAGSFYALAFVLLLGYALPKATAHAKVLNCTSGLAALAVFIIGGHIMWSVGFVMMAGQVIGARIAANLVLSKGQKLIRPVLICVSTVMSIKLIYDSHGDFFLQLFS